MRAADYVLVAEVVASRDMGGLAVGEKDGMWWKVEDENGNQGWVKNTDLEPAL